jgi:hypothetical protein
MPTSVPDEQTFFFLAIDPGKATGFAWFNGEQFGFGEIVGRFDFYEAFRMWSSAGAIPEVVIEDYVLDQNTHKKSRQVDALRIIGYIEGLCEQHGWPFEIQDRSKRAFADDGKLRALGWEATTPDGHAREAARHLLTYLVRKYGKPGQVGHDLLNKIMESTE